MEKILPIINPRKMHKKADEINKLPDDKNLLDNIDKTTKMHIIAMPKIFCLKKCILLFPN